MFHYLLYQKQKRGEQVDAFVQILQRLLFCLQSDMTDPYQQRLFGFNAYDTERSTPS